MITRVGFSAQADFACYGLFTETRSSLDQLIDIEAKLENFSMNHSRTFSDFMIAEQYQVLQTRFFEVTDLMGGNEAIFANRVGQLYEEVNTLEYNAQILAQGSQANLSYLMEAPYLLRPQLLYRLDGMDPHIKRVSFSQEVLEGVFWSKQPLHKRAITLIYKALKHGRIHATQTSGIHGFANDHSVFKVRITGHAVGAIRVAGFFIKEDFHIIVWSDESSHGEHASTRLTEQVNRVRDRFLRTGHY